MLISNMINEIIFPNFNSIVRMVFIKSNNYLKLEHLQKIELLSLTISLYATFSNDNKYLVLMSTFYLRNTIKKEYECNELLLNIDDSKEIVIEKLVERLTYILVGNTPYSDEERGINRCSV